VAVDRLDDLEALEARLNHPSVTWADCKTEATRLRSEASALVENEQLKEAQPLLELAKVRTSQGYKINRGVKSCWSASPTESRVLLELTVLSHHNLKVFEAVAAELNQLPITRWRLHMSPQEFRAPMVQGKYWAVGALFELAIILAYFMKKQKARVTKTNQPPPPPSVPSAWD
jgi:hypothetical protein